jgi:type II restriction enzyme
MNLQMNIEGARGFKSGAQIARVVSEDWAKGNLYCPACANDELAQTKNNTKVFDFVCPACVARFQLKSSRRWDERRIPDAGYAAMMEAISKDSNPNLFVLHYDGNWNVRNLLLVPSFFFTSSAIEKRPPLAITARRAGWVGCNILLSNIPSMGRIAIVAGGIVAERSEVRSRYEKIKAFSSLNTRVRGWALDVFRIVEMLPKKFALREVYAQEQRLAEAHPGNRNIRAKIRQQLQVLRDMGFITFLGGGDYLKI